MQSSQYIFSIGAFFITAIGYYSKASKIHNSRRLHEVKRNFTFKASVMSSFYLTDRNVDVF